jgi:hypothetical protein
VRLLVHEHPVEDIYHTGRSINYALRTADEKIASEIDGLRSQRAIAVNIAIMRAFVRLREILATHKDLARKLEELEKKYDDQFQIVFEAIRYLMEPPPEPDNKRRIGFGAD